MAKPSMIHLIDAGDQAAKDAVKWAQAQLGKGTESDVLAFEAGHRAGWRDAISYLKLHGFIALTDRAAAEGR
jgi:hypothetical protein